MCLYVNVLKKLLQLLVVMTIFEYKSYKKFVNDWLKLRPKAGHGEFRRFAEHLSVNSTFITQVFRGSVDLSVEQAYKLTQYLGLTDKEKDYFLLLVQVERAGDKSLKDYFQNKLAAAKQESTNLKDRLKASSELKKEHYYQFFSHWHYTVIVLLTALDKYQTAAQISEHLQLPLLQLRPMLDFLMEIGILQETKGKIKIKNLNIFVGQDSESVRRHHQNFRFKSQQFLDNADLSKNLFFTNPAVVSKEDAELIREKLIQFIEQYRKIAVPSPSEELYCLNIDWFKMG